MQAAAQSQTENPNRASRAYRGAAAAFSVAMAVALASMAQAQQPTLSVERTDEGATVRIDGELFTNYLTRSGSKPVLWPIIGPTGKPMTRSYPIGERQEHEKSDHIHHRSFWFTHGDVNGIDFWLEPNRPDQPHGVIDHQEFTKLEANGPTAVIATRNNWINGVTDEKVCEDEQQLVFGSDGTNRWIDYTITIKATEGDVTFGDTKEGTFGVRVAGTMKVEADMGGRIVNSEGQSSHGPRERDNDAWGKPAEWVDYTGPVDGETVGVAIFSHPQNFRHPTRWHVRTYGLFTANPFGMKDFPEVDQQQGAYTIKAGDSLTLRYCVYFHPQSTESADIPAAYQAYLARTP